MLSWVEHGKSFITLEPDLGLYCSLIIFYLMSMYLIVHSERKEGIVFKKGGTEIGKAMAEKSKGLFSADDWQCKR